MRDRAEFRGTRLGAWSVPELHTPSGRLALGLDETTHHTVVCPFFTLPDFLVAFASSTAIALRDLGVSSREADSEATAISLKARVRVGVSGVWGRSPAAAARERSEARHANRARLA